MVFQLTCIFTIFVLIHFVSDNILYIYSRRKRRKVFDVKLCNNNAE